MVSISNSYMGEKVLVTGASGFIGSQLCRRLRCTDAQIHAVSRTRSCTVDDNMRWWQCDLSEAACVRRLLKEIKPDIIFHLAGEVAGSRGLEYVVPAFRNNLLSTVNLLVTLSEIGCRRFILAGSLEEPDRSSSDITPCSPYAAAKFASSAYARMFHNLYRFPAVVARIFMVYGPAQRDLRKLIPYVIFSSLHGESPRLSSGARLVDWIYVGDVVEALLLMGKAPGIEGLTIDVGSGDLVSIRTVVELLVNMSNSGVSPAFGALPERPMEQIRAADSAKSASILRWKPQVSLRDGLQATLAWYTEHFSDIQKKWEQLAGITQ
jgi:nucleoside-diphosphate-sugar epimerase